MITTILATWMFSTLTAGDTPINCPVMPTSPANQKGVNVDYNGVRVSFCCAGCDVTFSNAPAKFINGKDAKGKVFGYSLFDPVSRTPIVAEKAKGSADYMGVRYYFGSEANKAEFAKDMKKFAALPKKEVMFCPVSGESIKSYASAGGYTDVDGTRYYFCCPKCMPAFDKDTKGFAEKVKSQATEPKAMKVQKDS